MRTVDRQSCLISQVNSFEAVARLRSMTGACGAPVTSTQLWEVLEVFRQHIARDVAAELASALAQQPAPSPRVVQISEALSKYSGPSGRRLKGTLLQLKSAVEIQRRWRGYYVRACLSSGLEFIQQEYDAAVVELERPARAAVCIQRHYRGHSLREQLFAGLAALEDAGMADCPIMSPRARTPRSTAGIAMQTPARTPRGARTPWSHMASARQAATATERAEEERLAAQAAQASLVQAAAEAAVLKQGAATEAAALKQAVADELATLKRAAEEEAAALTLAAKEEASHLRQAAEEAADSITRSSEEQAAAVNATAVGRALQFEEERALVLRRERLSSALSHAQRTGSAPHTAALDSPRRDSPRSRRTLLPTLSPRQVTKQSNQADTEAAGTNGKKAWSKAKVFKHVTVPSPDPTVAARVYVMPPCTLYPLAMHNRQR